jgi:hypothetical protein
MVSCCGFRETHSRYVVGERQTTDMAASQRNECHSKNAFKKNSYSPIPSDLDLSRMRAKELHIRILMIQQRNDQAPCLWPLLELEKLELEALQVIRRCGGRRGSIRLIDEL